MINFDNQFSNILEKYNKIETSLNQMSNQDSDNLIKLNREYAELKPIVDKIEEYKKEKNEIQNLNELLKDNDPEITKIAEIELQEKNIIFEILEDELLNYLYLKIKMIKKILFLKYEQELVVMKPHYLHQIY